MKYRKITFKNNPILGNASFNFTDASGKTVDTIILAGENGCGKSSLLSFLNNYRPGITARELGYSVYVEVELTDDDINLLYQTKDFVKSLGDDFSGNVVTFIHDTTFADDSSRVEYTSKNGMKKVWYAFLFGYDVNLYKSIFSDVEINFAPQEIRHTTSSNLDMDLLESVHSSHNLATEIKQLFVDIDELDNGDLAKWVDSHRGQPPIDEVLHTRMRRFTRAFDKMFPYKRFVGIDNRNGKKQVLFEEHGRQMELDQLSSGEKQIVFRGGFLLRNLGSINGASVLVDEPEISLHPQWQLKIMNFLKGLFTDENGRQTSQLIVATHSPFIIHNDTRANDKVIVMSKDEKGDVQILDKPEYYSWSESSVVEDAFNVYHFSNKNEILVFLEGETDETYFRKAAEVFGYDSNKISFNWIGHYAGNKKGQAENTGDKALNSAASFFKANPRMMGSSKVYLLYDCDTKKPDEQCGNLYSGAMAKNPKATKYQIGVENLLQLPKDFDYSTYYKQNTKTDEYGATSTIEGLDKTRLAQYIVGLSDDELKTILLNIKNEIDNILSRTNLL